MNDLHQVLPSPARHERLLNLTRNAVRSAQVLRRWPLAADRPLPDFVILGAQRSGTGSLFADLSQHPQVAKPIAKELHFFTLHHDRGERWYRAHFPRLQPGQQTFEATPYYLFHPDVPARVSALLPEARFVVLLRDPVRRAYSHYRHNRALQIEPLTFEQALDAEEARLAKAERLGLDSRLGARLHRSFSYLSRGMYAAQLQRWWSWVPPSHFQVYKSEDFYDNPREMYARVLDHLRLRPFTPDRFTKSNIRGSSDASVQAAPRTTFAELRRHFAADSEAVRRLLGWESAWTEEFGPSPAADHR